MGREVILFLLPGLVIVVLVIVEDATFKAVELGLSFLRDAITRFR